MKKTPTKPRKSPKKTKSTVSTPRKQMASTPKKKQRVSTATPGSATRKAQTPFTPFTPRVTNSRKAREAQMHMQLYGTAVAPVAFIDLTADSGDDATVVGDQSLPHPTQHTEDEGVI